MIPLDLHSAVCIKCKKCIISFKSGEHQTYGKTLRNLYSVIDVRNTRQPVLSLPV